MNERPTTSSLPLDGLPRSPLRALRRTLAAAAAIATAAALAASPVARAERPRIFAINGGRVIVAPGHVIEGGTVVLRDGLIESVGKDVRIPPDAVEVDAKGKTVHAGFIDACSEGGFPRAEQPATAGGGPPVAAGPARVGGQGSQAPTGAVHPITRVHPERRVLDLLDLSDKDVEKRRGMGFTTALTVPGPGIFRGTSALVNMGDGLLAQNILRPEVAQHIGFDHGSFGEGYPGSLMGAMAAIRQGFEDARRHQVWQTRYDADPRGMKRPDTLSAYEPLERAVSGKIPVVFDATTPNDVLRALGLGREYGLGTIVVASGADYEVVDGIKASGRPLIVPLAFPDRPDVADADEALDVETRTLQRYLGARANPARLAAAGVPFAFGTCRMKNVADFPSNLRKVIEAGLPSDAALAALTTVPARLLGVERSLGTLEPGKAADVVVEDGELFGEKTKPVRVYVDGTEYLVEEKKPRGDPNAKVDPRGTWSVVFTVGPSTFTRAWTIRGTEGAYEGMAETREGTVPFTSIKLVGNEMTVLLASAGTGQAQEITVIVTGDEFEGSGELANGRSFTVRGTRTSGTPRAGGAAEEMKDGTREELGGLEDLS